MKKNLHDAVAAIFHELDVVRRRLKHGLLFIEGCWLLSWWLLRLPFHTWLLFRVCLEENILLRWLLAPGKTRQLPSDDVFSGEHRPSKVKYVDWYRGSFFNVSRSRPRSRIVGGVIAAGLLLSLSFGLNTLIARSSEQPSSTITTAFDQPRTVDLPDGSIAKLDRRSQIKSEYVGGKRVVRLLWGRAMFAVEPDKQRPFIVKARGIDTTAVGTRFTVSIDQASVNVDVHEGVVTVRSERNDDQALEIMLHQGEKGRFPVESVEPVAR